MIESRSCSKNSTWFNGSNRYYCGTHNHEMTNEQYQCAIGQAENYLVSRLSPLLYQFEQRIKDLEIHFNDKLKTFAANLEKLHERDPTEPPR